MFKIILITADDSKFSIVKDIRTTVFTNEQGASREEEFDCFDGVGQPALFALLYEGEKPAGTARLVLNEDGYKLGRIAVLKQFRGEGYGDALVRTLLEKAFSMGAQEVFVDSQNHAIPFYEKIGFTVIGKEIIDRGIKHTQMSIKRGNVRTNCSCRHK